ncbi:MAG: hypothetical protein FWD58_09700 [Firmicutes bacterium]|nr:hypothetical protein [Bacillota bacterium]
MKRYEDVNTKDLVKSIRMLQKWHIKISRLRYIPVPEKEIRGLEGQPLAEKLMAYKRGYLFEPFIQLKLMQEELDKRHGKF